MTGRDMMRFLERLSRCSKQVIDSDAAAALRLNSEICEEEIPKVHSQYPTKTTDLRRLKVQLVDQYARKDQDGQAVVIPQKIGETTVVDYDFGLNRAFVYQQLNAVVTNTSRRRGQISQIIDQDVDLNFSKVSEDKIPEEIRDDLDDMIEKVEIRGATIL